MKKLTLLLFAMLLPLMASAYDAYIGGIYYNFDQDNKTAVVTYDSSNSSAYSGNVIIPESVTYNGVTYPVTSIGNFAFSYCSDLSSIEIPNSVTSIGYGAFQGCSGLISIIIPNSVTSIGDFAFRFCSSLTSVTIPNSVTYFGGGAFWGCSGLTSVTIGNSVTSIRDYAFYECI